MLLDCTLSSAENPGTENISCCTVMEQQEVVGAMHSCFARLSSCFYQTDYFHEIQQSHSCIYPEEFKTKVHTKLSTCLGGLVYNF